MNSNQWLDQLKKKRKVRMVFSILMIIASSLLQTYVIQAFINPANLLSAGFTGVAILLDRIARLLSFGGQTLYAVQLAAILSDFLFAGSPAV